MIPVYSMLLRKYLSNSESERERERENFKSGDDKKASPSLIVNAINIVFFILAVVLAVVPAVLVAQRCNPELKVRYGILAFFFSDIYIFQWAIRKFVMNEPEYCMMI
tara:strand:+ start:443 stop:763 length:321 start_codon:yes stop_codon:yes gene_type:complete